MRSSTATARASQTTAALPTIVGRCMRRMADGESKRGKPVKQRHIVVNPGWAARAVAWSAAGVTRRSEAGLISKKANK
jgi:hypothetical protein